MRQSVVDIKMNPGTRTYVIGDIHGCYQELLALEKRIRMLAARSKIETVRFLSLGDLCDRGPDTKEVIEHFVNGKAAGTHDVILGNHETFFLLAFAGLRRDLLTAASVELSWYHESLFKLFRAQMTNIAAWRQNGGRSVFESYGANIDDLDSWDRVPSSHLKLLFEAPLVFRGPNVLISHALMGVGDLALLEAKDHGQPVDERELHAAVVRCLWEREYPQAMVVEGGRHISGHTPLVRVIREKQAGTIQIDTGAVYGGQLSAIDLKSLRVTAVKSQFSCREKVEKKI
jgi:serine/threonine protein phosphatase 1